MITLKTAQHTLHEISCDAYAFFLKRDFTAHDVSAAVPLLPQIYQALEARGFRGSPGSAAELTAIYNNRPISLLFFGLGAPNAQGLYTLETYRRALGRLIRYTETYKLKTVAMQLANSTLFNVSPERLAREVATMVHKASYHFDEFITNPERKLSFDVTLWLALDGADSASITTAIAQGEALGHAINRARYWCDLPPASLTPTRFAEYAQELAHEHKLGITVFNQEQILAMGMGGIAGVGKGSEQESRLVVLEYKTQRKNAPTIALVGKGVTFDSGGLSIKPAVAMESMKDDMAGAAVVIATMGALAYLKPDVNVTAFAPMVENMPSGTAIRPGDILRFYNGKTAEVKNTDAEGRLILADALSYAVKNYKLDAIIDIATLTGACAQALGHFYAGLMSNHDSLVDKLLAASHSSGDRLWRLPLDTDYKAAIRSDVADICNIGSPTYKAGAITAAWFLENFVGDVPWAHIDIAGTAFGVPDMSYYRAGATGFGIRLFTDLLMDWN